MAHLAQRDVTLVVVSRAPLGEIEAYKKRMGWKFKWVSSYGTDFNIDFHVSFTQEETERQGAEYNYMVGGTAVPSARLSAFIKDARRRLHTYSSYARGLDLMRTYNFLDLAPKGRDEAGRGPSWVRRHDEYARRSRWLRLKRGGTAMTLPITACTRDLALIVRGAAVNVTVHRVKLRVPLGDGGNAQMLRMIRLHGNAAEYIPFASC